MKVAKFKKGDIAYHFNGGTIPSNVSFNVGYSLQLVSAWTIHVKEVKNGIVHGFTHRAFNEFKHLPWPAFKALLFESMGQEKFKKLKLADIVTVKFSARVYDLMTREELKLAMIKYIANDFSEPDDGASY